MIIPCLDTSSLPRDVILAEAEKLSVFGEFAVITTGEYINYKDVVHELVNTYECRVYVDSKITLDECVDLLNTGANKIVFLQQCMKPEILSLLPPERIMVSVDLSSIQTSLQDSVKSLVGGVTLVVGGELNMETLQKAKEFIGKSHHVTVFMRDTCKLSDVSAAAKIGISIQILDKSVDLGEAVAATLVSDRSDGLFPTVVVDEQGVALGLVYSSVESIKESVKTKQGVYHSRKRGLWRKGETSGATQSLIQVRVDCDSDCLCYIVKQHGTGFCHVPDQWTCWGESGGLGKLMRTLQSRKDHPIPGSYTNRLFNEQNLLAAKLREEAEELNVASANQKSSEITAEAADVIYFALVTAVKGGVSLKQIENELDKRAKKITRRKGDAKPWALTPSQSQTYLQTPLSQPVQKEKPTFSTLKQRSPTEILTSEKVDPTDPAAVKIAKEIFDDVRKRGEEAVLFHAKRLGDIKEEDPFLIGKDEMKKVFDSLPQQQQELLQRSVSRVKLFAQAQRDSIQDLKTPIEGGSAGHTISAVDRAGCYAPGGRFPLPSSVIMTAVTARVAGVKEVWVASPRPVPITIGAAYVSGADSLLCVGGAQAIAALALGAGRVPPCDAIVGPGNKFVTAAKSIASGIVKIDMLAGPSEVLIIADSTCDPKIVAADMLAQCEHDTDAMAVLITVNDRSITSRVEAELTKQLAALETREIATVSLATNSFFVDVKDLDEAFQISDKIGPEHLELHIKDAEKYIHKPNHYGSLFVGENSAEVLGDYCAGPNHVLPTRGTARYVGGLSVFTFLRVRTWSKMDPFSSQNVVEDSVLLGELEGLVGHSTAAKLRRKNSEERGKVKRKVDELIYEKYIRPDFHSLPQYVPVKPLDVLAAEIGVPMENLLKLNANENNYGPHPAVLEAINSSPFPPTSSLPKSIHHIYPDPSQTYLRQEIARDLQVPPECIVAGSGADDLLDITIRLIPDHRPIIVSNPTFGMYSFLGQISKHKIINVPRKAGWEVDIDEIIRVAKETHAALIFMTSPNNPTGNMIPISGIHRLIRETDNCFVAVDEAYIQFAVDLSSTTNSGNYSRQADALSVVRHVTDCPNLIIFHTFSKWAALAGLRVGYAVCHPTVARAMDSIKQPYNVNSGADLAARAALKHKEDIIRDHVNKIILERENMYKLLAKYSWLKPYGQSQANFILTHVIGKCSWMINEYLYSQGCLVRYYSTPELQSCIRISVGTPEDTKKLANYLEKIHTKDFLADYVKECEAILWDMDGVIANVSGSYRTAIIETCKFFGVLVENSDIEKAKSRGNANNDWHLTLNLIKEKKSQQKSSEGIPSLEEVTQKFEELYHGTPTVTGLHERELLIPSLELLESLSKKYKMAVVTGRPRKDCNIFLNRFNLHKYFQSVVCMEDTPKPKPDAGPCLKALQELSAKKAIMIGDTPDDIVSANLAKIGAIGALVVPGSNKELVRDSILGVGALRIITELNELATIFSVNS